MAPSLEARPKHEPTAWLLLAWGAICGPLVAACLSWGRSAWLAMLLYHAACLWLGTRHGTLGARPRIVALLAAAIGSAVVVGAVTSVVLAWVPETRLPMTSWRSWGLRPPHDVWILTYYVAVNPWAEELFWRGALLGPSLRGALPQRMRAWISAGAFALFHVFVLREAYEDVLVVGTAVGCILLAAIVWVVVRVRTGNVWWCAVTHQGINLALAFVYAVHLRDRG